MAGSLQSNSTRWNVGFRRRGSLFMIPQPLQAVIFDMDGLLLDTEALYRTSIYGACASLAHEMIGALHLSLIGTPKDVGDAKLIAHFGAAFDLDAYHRNCSTHF